MTMVNSGLAEDHKRAIDQQFGCWSAHDMDRLLRLYTNDAVYEDVAMGVVNRGGAELRAFGEGILSGFPDVTFELRSSFASPSGGGAEWVMRGTHKGDLPGMPATGRRIEVRGASVFEFEGNKIRRCSDYFDMMTLLKQLGLMPTT
jgi:steroid delta-isomerase-like uncharacterized protein